MKQFATTNSYNCVITVKICILWSNPFKNINLATVKY